MVKNNSYGITTKTRSSSSSTSYISSLSNEILVEIFCRLGSPKYATQCKCVCKRWSSVFNNTNSRDSYFLSRWREINPEDEQEAEKPIALLTQYRLWNDDSSDEEEDSEYENHHGIDYLSLHTKDLPTFKFLDFLPCYTSNNIITVSLLPFDIATINPIYVLATSKDLLLCCPNEKDHSVYYVCNPFSRQWTALPPPPPIPPSYKTYVIRVGLVVFDDDEYGNDLNYRVVRLLYEGEFDDNLLKLEIFSSDDSSFQWRVIEIRELLHSYMTSREVVFYDEMLVWRSTSPKGERVIGFKIPTRRDDNANYTLFPLPRHYEVCSSSSKIGVCSGCLRIGQLVYNTIPDITDYNEVNVPNLIIWELNRHSQRWELVHELNFCKVDLREDENTKDYSFIENKWFFGNILAFHPNDGDILYLDFVWCHMSVTCSCNVREKTVEMIRLLPLWESSYNVFQLNIASWPTPVPLLPRSADLQKRS